MPVFIKALLFSVVWIMSLFVFQMLDYVIISSLLVTAFLSPSDRQTLKQLSPPPDRLKT